MNRLDWKIQRHRARVLDRYWRSLPTARMMAGWLAQGRISPIERYRRFPPTSIRSRWNINKGREDDREARASAVRALMRANISQTISF